MSEFQKIPLPLVNLCLICFLVSTLCKATDFISSCLTHHNVSNFTLLPTSQDATSTVYYELLRFPIQNMRYAEVGVPKPLAVILPESKEQLVESVLCCRAASLEIRVRCGGHSYEGLSSVSNDKTPFVIIDMMKLNRVIVDLVSETAWVEGGATFGEVYHAIAESSSVLGFPAGVNPTVGSSGQILGGGVGVLARKYGLAADNVEDALLVDADGRLSDREAMGEEVFWALRGGGGGMWGIIFAWKIKLVRVSPIVTVFSISRRGQKHELANLLYKWQLVAPFLDDGLHVSVYVGAALPEFKDERSKASATFKGFYLGPRTEVLSMLNESFPELTIEEDDCIEMSWIESVLYFSGLQNGSTVSDLRKRYNQHKFYFKVKSDYVKTPILAEVFRSMLDILEKEPKGFLILDPYGGAMHRISGDSVAFPHREGNLFNIHYTVRWTEEDNINSDHYLNWIRGFYDYMTPFVSSSPRGACVNYVDLDLGVMDWLNITGNDNVAEIARVWGEKYFLSNYNRLIRAKTLIDPNNVFRHQQSIPPVSSVMKHDSAMDKHFPSATLFEFNII
ncbi:hypothetical protein Ancab_033573 [Ancistrocladus abbreviatus]